MYTWGYIKEAVLAKLDLDESEANEQRLFNRFHIYANEAMTQICSAVKPNRTFAKFVITEKDFEENDEIIKTMPDDFISFGDDVNTIKYNDFMYNTILARCYDDDIEYVGYNKIKFKRVGEYSISYNARWVIFSPVMENSQVLNVPTDILDCLPSYIASQCYKIDDETKSSICRNEYEMFLSRIDDTDFKQTKTFTIGGDW